MGLLGQKECTCDIAGLPNFLSWVLYHFTLPLSMYERSYFSYSLGIRICCHTFGLLSIWQVINSNSVKLCKLFIIMRSSIFLSILVSFAYLILYAVLCYLLYSSCRNCPGEYKNRPFPFCLYLKAQFTDQGLNPHPLDWKRRILTTELPGSPNRPYPWRNLLIQMICPKS